MNRQKTVVENKKEVLRLLVKRTFNDSKYFEKEYGFKKNYNEVVSRASFVIIVLYVVKIVIALEISRGYTLAIEGLLKNPVSAEIISAQQELVSRHALHHLQRDRNQITVRLDRLKN